MKGHIHSDDFGQLADKGWNDLSARLDRELPTPKVPIYRLPYQKIAIVLALLCGVLLFTMMLSKQKTKRAPFQPIPQIVNNISFNVQQPDIVLNLVEPSISPILSEKNPIFAKAERQDINNSSVESTSISAHSPVIGLKHSFFSHYISQLPIIQRTVSSEKIAEVTSNQKQVKLKQLALNKRHTRLGFNVSSGMHGKMQSASVGGGISVSFPIGKRFSVEPGVGYDMMRFNELKIANEGDEFSLARAVMATPSLDVKYRVRKSIEMPLSIHYQPIRQLALTGGVDVGLLISQKMVFESNGYSGFDAYKKQLNEGELNQLNRVNIGAHGGVSWFPSNDWKLGLYYGQNLTSEKKLKQQKLKFSNHIFKVRMARYF